MPRDLTLAVIIKLKDKDVSLSFEKDCFMVKIGKLKSFFLSYFRENRFKFCLAKQRKLSLFSLISKEKKVAISAHSFSQKVRLYITAIFS